MWLGGALALCALSLCASGCYLHHERLSATETTTDAATDATIEASADAGVDAALDAPWDGGPDAGRCELVTLRPEPILAPVDIVWAIDSSRSMQDERERLQATINEFARRVRQRVPDLHVIVITLDNIVPAPLGTDDNSFRFVPLSVDSDQALTVLIDQVDSYRDFLRPEALLHFVVVSDDDSALPADAFLGNAEALFQKPFTVHAIASPDVNGEPCRSAVPSPLCLQTGIQAVCGAAEIGDQYYRAADATLGLSVNVCLDDWSEVVGPLSDAVVGSDPVPCRSPLPHHADGTFVVEVEASLRISGVSAQPVSEVSAAVECGDALSFYRESHEWADFDTLVLCPATCVTVTRSRSEIDLRFDCPPAAN